LIHSVVRDWRLAELSEIDKALGVYASKLTHSQHEIDDNDVSGLRSLGLDDRAIHDATQVIAYFNYITRIADALDVPAEPGIETWGT